jgi:RNA-directed DNA polymerase
MQKSAEGIVVAAHSDKGPNMEGRRGTKTSTDEGDAPSWMIWIRNLNGEDTASAGTPMTVNIYVRSKAAGEQVMHSITRFLAKKLRLKVNEDKSAVDRPWKRKFLGYSMTSHHRPKPKVTQNSIKRVKGRTKEIMRKLRGRSLPNGVGELTTLLRGWVNYFLLSQVKVAFEELDQWIRRKLRCILWRQWKKPRTRAIKLLNKG